MPLRRTHAAWAAAAAGLFLQAGTAFAAPKDAAEALEQELAERGADKPTVAVLAVHQPADMNGNHAGYFSVFSGWPLPKGDLLVSAPGDRLGCEEYPEDFASAASGGLGPAPGVVAVVLRGECTFVQKALMAKKAGAAGVIVVSDTEQVQPMGAGKDRDALTVDIFVVGVGKSFGEALRKESLRAKEAGGSPPTLSISPYVSSLLNISEGILICLATALVALGAFFSTSDLSIHPQGSFSHALAPPEEEVMEVDNWLAVGFCGVGSCFLVFLFFFMHYMIYVIIFCFCLGGASCITQFISISLTHTVPAMKNKSFSVPWLGPVAHADILASVPALALVVTWVFLRNTPYGWPFQDIIGAGFLCWLQRTLRLPNMQIATLLLSVMFFFDIFWVFISPLFFHESVMVRVATGGGTGESVPMLLKIPAVGDAFGNDRLLGFGDIALPGLLVSYLRRHDLLSRRTLTQGYFLPALVGYFIGLNVTIAALVVMRMGQPALLYLVPGTLGTTLVLSCCRGELRCLWDGTPVREQVSGDSSEEERSGYKNSP